MAGGMLYGAYGSYADTDPYHGWVLGFKATNLARSASYAFNTTPNATVATFGANASEGALWMGGNRTYTAWTSATIFILPRPMAVLAPTPMAAIMGTVSVKLSTSNGLAVADYFTPYNQAALAANDTDLGSGGTILLPDSVGSTNHLHLMVGCGKDGILRLVDRDNMGRYQANNDNQIVQEVPGAIGGAFSTPAYLQPAHLLSSLRRRDEIVLHQQRRHHPHACLPSHNQLQRSWWHAFDFCQRHQQRHCLDDPVFGDGGPDVLHAYNATNLAQELYNSSQNLARDNPGAAIIMTTPTVVNGKVFVGAQYTLSIFGNSLFLATPVISPNGGSFIDDVTVTLSDATPNSTIYYTLDGTAPTTNSLVYTGPFVP